jgi:hypothetical protein
MSLSYTKTEERCFIIPFQFLYKNLFVKLNMTVHLILISWFLLCEVNCCFSLHVTMRIRFKNNSEHCFLVANCLQVNITSGNVVVRFYNSALLFLKVKSLGFIIECAWNENITKWFRKMKERCEHCTSTSVEVSACFNWSVKGKALVFISSIFLYDSHWWYMEWGITFRASNLCHK